MSYDVICTTVTDRNDLFVQSMESLLAMVDVPPSCIILHEDTRKHADTKKHDGQALAWLEEAKAAGRIEDFRHRCCTPAQGMGPAVVWCMETAAIRATGPFVLFTQEDWEFIRPTPVGRCMDLMEKHDLNHVRFNKRKTMPAKHADTDHPWHKVQVAFLEDGSMFYGVDKDFVACREPGDDVLCVSDHWYTQTSVWRIEPTLPTLRAAVEMNPAAHGFVPAFNHYMNLLAGNNSSKDWADQRFRHEKLKTYIWGPIKEKPFIRHLGSRRGTGHIKDHLAEPAP